MEASQGINPKCYSSLDYLLYLDLKCLPKAAVNFQRGAVGSLWKEPLRSGWWYILRELEASSWKPGFFPFLSNSSRQVGLLYCKLCGKSLFHQSPKCNRANWSWTEIFITLGQDKSPFEVGLSQTFVINGRHLAHVPAIQKTWIVWVCWPQSEHK